MAHLHWRRRTRLQARVRIWNPMTTLYYAEHTHATQTQTRIPTPYFCTGQESESESVPESISGNVNEPLQQLKRYKKKLLVVMAYSYCRIQTRIPTRTQIPVLCRNFTLVWIRTLIPWLKCMNRDEHLSPGWISVPKMGTVTIQETLHTGIWIWIQTNVNIST